MKTLPEILRDALLLLEQLDCGESVVIARGQQLEASRGPSPKLLRCEAFQVRLQRESSDNYADAKLAIRARVWRNGGWSPWIERRSWLHGASFDIQDVLATDWRIVSSRNNTPQAAP